MNGVERLVALVNPSSTRAEAVKGPLQELGQSAYGHNAQTLYTGRKAEETIERLSSTLEEGDVLCIAGGDGTVRSSMQALLSESLAPKKVPMLPLWGGNGNAVARLLNGPINSQPSKLLDAGHIAEIHPMQWTIADAEQTRTEQAALVGSLGLVAHLLTRMNSPEYRNQVGYGKAPLRHLYQATSYFTAARDTEPFSYTLDGDSTSQTYYDLTAANASMPQAKIPVKLDEQRLFAFTTDSLTLRSIAQGAIQLARGTRPGSFVTPENPYSFSLHEPALLQFDGEAETTPLQPETTIDIRPSDQSFLAVTTRL